MISSPRILKLARREHVTQIVVGTRRRSRWQALVSRSLPDALARQASGLGIHVVTGDGETGLHLSPALPRPRLRDLQRSALTALGFVAATTLMAVIIDRFVNLPNISLIFLLAVLGAAVVGGYVAAFLAAALSALAYNFYFIDPIHTFTIAAPHEVFALFIFIAVAVIAGGFASRIREQAEAARVRASALQSLYDFSRKLSTTAKSEDALWLAVSQLQASLRRKVVLLLPKKGELTVAAAWPPDTELDLTDYTAARWAHDKREAAGHGTGTLPNSRFAFRPLSAPTVSSVSAASSMRASARPQCRARAGRHPRPDGDCARPRAARRRDGGAGRTAGGRALPRGAALLHLA